MKLVNGEDEKSCSAAVEEIAMMQRELARMHDRLDHLQYLPKIAHSLETLTDKLVKPATDKTSVMLISAMLAVVVVILVLKDTDKGVKITSSGFEMGTSNGSQTR